MQNGESNFLHKPSFCQSSDSGGREGGDRSGRVTSKDQFSSNYLLSLDRRAEYVINSLNGGKKKIISFQLEWAMKWKDWVFPKSSESLFSKTPSSLWNAQRSIFSNILVLVDTNQRLRFCPLNTWCWLYLCIGEYRWWAPRVMSSYWLNAPGDLHADWYSVMLSVALPSVFRSLESTWDSQRFPGGVKTPRFPLESMEGDSGASEGGSPKPSKVSRETQSKLTEDCRGERSISNPSLLQGIGIAQCYVEVSPKGGATSFLAKTGGSGTPFSFQYEEEEGGSLMMNETKMGGVLPWEAVLGWGSPLPPTEDTPLHVGYVGMPLSQRKGVQPYHGSLSQSTGTLLGGGRGGFVSHQAEQGIKYRPPTQEKVLVKKGKSHRKQTSF